EIATVDSMTSPVTLGAVTKPLTTWMVEGAINPGQLQIAREILYDEEGNDTAIYWDDRANYDIDEKANGWITIEHVDVDDAAINPDTGKHRFSDGLDTVRNMEVLSFADKDIHVFTD